MQIWVDADACPKVIRDILFRAAKRVKVNITLVANRTMRVPASHYIKTILVPSGLDVADEQILQLVQSGDLVVTADIPFASAVIEQGAVVLTPRGRVYTKDNIGEQLSIRNFMDELRGSGVETGGPSRLNNKDREIFANELNKFLTSD
ncbi:YaiI/YqxD family protein [candidate division KSB1 bacterium]|nr:YaiI/YqxD family protein [candidate division KSB1 bacterium]